jgi:putative methionine-R-sulfoxide reductase with GAF domain
MGFYLFAVLHADSASMSELVIPIIDAHNNCIGVLDLDSPIENGIATLLLVFNK